jgi:hypothetical protein
VIATGSTSPLTLVVVLVLFLLIVAGAAALERLRAADPVVDAAWTRFVDAMKAGRR